MHPRPTVAGAGGLHDDLPAVRRGERGDLGPVVLRRVETRAQAIRTLLSYVGAVVMAAIAGIPSRYLRCDTRFRD